MSATFSITFQKKGKTWNITRCVKARNGTKEEIDVAMELNDLIRDKLFESGRHGAEVVPGGVPELRRKDEA